MIAVDEYWAWQLRGLFNFLNISMTNLKIVVTWQDYCCGPVDSIVGGEPVDGCRVRAIWGEGPLITCSGDSGGAKPRISNILHHHLMYGDPKSRDI